MDISGATAIVTGGASGLGNATARALAARGALVAIADLQEEAGTKAAAEIGGIFLHTDVTDEASVEAAVAAASAAGPLRVLVNCAGIAIAARTVSRDGEPHPLAQFQKVITINLVGTFNCIRLAAPAMAVTEPGPDGERGAILNTASVAAFEGQIGQAAYAASKGGIVGMTIPIARDLASIGVRVNTIAPGLMDTPIYDQVGGGGDSSTSFKEQLGKNVVFPSRMGYPEEYSSLAVELITNSYMNGEIVRLDGAIRLPPR
jgi:NAD(P)-dependent dehydrogenase (short-subunit alcohol dehydrogenase family)